MAISRPEVAEMLVRVRESVRHEPCWTCDCIQGLLVQLELEADEDVTDLTAELKAPRERMHGCIGCDPCPPGAVYADFLRLCNVRNFDREDCR